MGYVIALIITAVIVIAAVVYIVREKKKGRKCIGCPHDCAHCQSACSCHSDEKSE